MPKDIGLNFNNVTPHVGVWIETKLILSGGNGITVTPHVGVWIETVDRPDQFQFFGVTPHVGVWIETSLIVLESVNT